jgi:hypothetical protein
MHAIRQGTAPEDPPPPPPFPSSSTPQASDVHMGGGGLPEVQVGGGAIRGRGGGQRGRRLEMRSPVEIWLEVAQTEMGTMERAVADLRKVVSHLCFQHCQQHQTAAHGHGLRADVRAGAGGEALSVPLSLLNQPSFADNAAAAPGNRSTSSPPHEHAAPRPRVSTEVSEGGGGGGGGEGGGEED